MFKIFSIWLFLYGFLTSGGGHFHGCRCASHVMSQEDLHLLKQMEEGVQSGSSDHLDHDFRLSYYSESFAGSP